MHAACFAVTLKIFGAMSLKEKRMVTRSVKERCKSRFNVSVVECGYADKWQMCRLCFAIAAISSTAAANNMQSIIDYLDADDRIEIVDIEKF